MLKRYSFFAVSVIITILILMIPASLTLIGGRSTVERESPLEEYPAIDEIGRISQEGMKIASHSEYSEDIDRSTSQQIEEEVEGDLSRFKEAGIEPNYYFPSSYKYDGRVINAVQKHSDDLGFSTSLPGDIIGNESAPPLGLLDLEDPTRETSYEEVVEADPTIISIDAREWDERERLLKEYIEYLLEERSSVRLVIKDIDADIQGSKLDNMI